MMKTFWKGLLLDTYKLGELFRCRPLQNVHSLKYHRNSWLPSPFGLLGAGRENLQLPTPFHHFPLSLTINFHGSSFSLKAWRCRGCYRRNKKDFTGGPKRKQNETADSTLCYCLADWKELQRCPWARGIGICEKQRIWLAEIQCCDWRCLVGLGFHWLTPVRPHQTSVISIFVLSMAGTSPDQSSISTRNWNS